MKKVRGKKKLELVKFTVLKFDQMRSTKGGDFNHRNTNGGGNDTLRPTD